MTDPQQGRTGEAAHRTVNTLTALGLVGLGGSLGSLARHLALAAMPTRDSAVAGAVGLAAVNISGALLLGAILALLAGRHSRLSLLLGTGLCGGFTTYSAFVVGTLELAELSPLIAGISAVAAVLTGVVATAFGVWIGERIRAVKSFGSKPSRRGGVA